jgi:hypothetical protein
MEQIEPHRRPYYPPTAPRVLPKSPPNHAPWGGNGHAQSYRTHPVRTPSRTIRTDGVSILCRFPHGVLRRFQKRLFSRILFPNCRFSSTGARQNDPHDFDGPLHQVLVVAIFPLCPCPTGRQGFSLQGHRRRRPRHHHPRPRSGPLSPSPRTPWPSVLHCRPGARW